MKRRAFLKAAVAVIQSGIALVVTVPGVRYLLGPARGRPKEAGFLRVIPLSALSEGRPVRVVVSAERYDAYTHHPSGPIGSVWLVRERGERAGATGSRNVSPTPEGMGHARTAPSPKIRCLQTICPHLGCGIDFAEDRGAFSCPCHASEFDRSGKRVSGPAPRDMDELACRVTDPDEDGQRWVEVRYQEFRTGVADRSSIAD